MSSDNHRHDIYDLFFSSLCGTASEEQQQRLAQLLEEDSDLQKEYIDYLINYTLLHRRSVASIFMEDRKEPTLDQMLWESFAYEEMTAPVVELPREEEKLQQDLIQKVVHLPYEKRKLSTSNKVFLVMNVAAVLFIVLFLWFAPSKPVEVATLSDSIDAKWADVDASMQKGARLHNSREKLLLRQGLVELTFDNQTKAVVEGPAEFQILADDRIGLIFGKVYATVSPSAIGFSVFTHNSKIFDLGTEFGVEADTRGNTHLHVLKGSTMLVAGAGQSDKKGLTVEKGMAKKVSAVNSEISEISCDSLTFVHNIDSGTGMIWRGENLSLASITAGLDGFQEIDSLVSLDPMNAKYVTSVKDVYKRTNNAYNTIPDLQFIDGVFVPDGEFGPVQISSTGLTFDCPDTSGVFTHEISAYRGPIENQHETIPPAIIDGQEIVNDPILMLHSNAGITFDLQAVRASLPQLDLKRFKATAVTTQNNTPRFKFLILVNGQIKYQKDILGNEGDKDPFGFDIHLDPKDRFLTLIITDVLQVTDDQAEKESFPYSNDFIYLIQPELCLTNGLK